MKYLMRSLLAAIVVMPMAAASTHAAETDAFVVMAYNVRYGRWSGPEAWPKRRVAAKAMLAETKPDLIGTQEVLYQQAKDLDADLPGHDWIGLGREGGSRGEFMAVYYRRDRFEPLAFDHYWLSETPDVIGSKSWKTACTRMVTWVKFKDRQTGKGLLFINTHFDHRSKLAREKSAELVLKRVRDRKTDLPIILVGDFNAVAEDSKPYETLVGPGAFADTWLTAKKRGEAVNTFHGYRGPKAGNRRIDWILTRGPVQALSTEIVTFELDGQYPSDHFPVVARLRLGAE